MTSFETLIDTHEAIHDLLLKYFKKNSSLIIFDIGSCDGIDSIRYRKLFPNCFIHSFEPLLKNFSLLEKNASDFLKVNYKLNQKGVSDKIETCDLFVSSGRPLDGDENWDYGNKSSSILPPKEVLNQYEWLKFNEKMTIETIDLNTYTVIEKIDFIDFIHMDIQGAELNALRGLGEKITKVKSLFLEVSEKNLYENQPLKKEIETFLKSSGFTLIHEKIINGEGDQFYVNLSYFPRKRLTHKIYSFYNKLLKFRSYSKYKTVSGKHYMSDEDKLKRRNFYQALLKPDSLIFDIGANYGNRIEPIFDLNYTIIAVEPQKECADYLRTIYKNKITVIEKGMSDKESLEKMYRCQESVLTTFSTEFINEVKASGRFTNLDWDTSGENYIEMTTLDNLISKYGIPDFVKIDVEGFELKVLKGLTNKIPLISFEYTTPELLDNLKNCLRHINTLSLDYKFNYSIGESLQFELEEWLAFEKFIELIHETKFINSRFGDIYARLK